jgi:polyhydroxybutyrate depolymerase
MDLDPGQCAGKSANVLHIHGDADATISYEGGAIFAQSYPSTKEVIKRWSTNNQCTAGSEKKSDLIAAMSGPETTTSPFNCANGSLELWTLNGGVHVPVLDRGFADAVVQWLINNKSA